MPRPRLALLNAAVADEHTTRNFRRELAADLAEFDVTDGHLPSHTDFDGFVVTGSKTSVYDDEPWIAETEAWTREAVDAGLPALGVCWGHQLLAQALGGTVEDMGEFEIGYREVERVGESDLLAGVDDPFTVFVTHGDAVTELPRGATPIAENEYGNHGFQVGRVHTVQFHPEYDLETARDVTAGKTFLGADRIESVIADVTDDNYGAACHAKRLFDNFVAYVDEVRTSADSTAA
jgi:GMP synthase (glutamine-hydrolysing)